MRGIIRSYWIVLPLFLIPSCIVSSITVGKSLSSLAVVNTAWADHGESQFDPDHNDREREQDAIQELYGLNIIRGEGMIEGTNKADFIIGSLIADTVIGRDGDDEIQTQLDIDQVYAGDGDDTVQGGLA